jgi:hypothetical protein
MLARVVVLDARDAGVRRDGHGPRDVGQLHRGRRRGDGLVVGQPEPEDHDDERRCAERRSAQRCAGDASQKNGMG